jgi:hypothetical protein
MLLRAASPDAASIPFGRDDRRRIPVRVARALPGFSPDDMMAELRTLAGELVELELLRYEPPPLEIDMGLYGVFARVRTLQSRDSTRR